MGAGIAANFDPLLYARTGRQIHGKLPVKAMPRLAEMSADPSYGWVDVDLSFSRDNAHRNWLQGNLRGQMKVVCQRCLGQMLLDLECDINVMLVSHADSTAVNEPISENEVPQIFCQGKTTVAKLIEDDLLLAMPMFPKHESGNCQSAVSNNRKRDGVEKPVFGQKSNPFDVLASLKTAKKKSKTSGKKEN